MARERKFHFVALDRKHTIKTGREEKEPYLRIQRTGSLNIPRKTMESLGYTWGPTAFKFYYDLEARSIGFVVLKNSSLSDEMRLLKPYRAGKSNFEFLQTSVKTFMSVLTGVSYPLPALKIYTYTGDDVIPGKIHYVQIPKNVRAPKAGEILSTG